MADARLLTAGSPARLGRTWRTPAVKPVLVLQFSLLLLVVCNLGRIPVLDLGDREAPLLVGDFGAAAVLVAMLLTAMRNRSLRLDGVALAGLLFAAIGGLSALSAMPRFALTGFELMASLAYLARWLVYFGLYIATINYVRADNSAAVWRAMEQAMLAFALFGIVQSIFLPNFAQMVYPEDANKMDWQGHRLMSTVLEPNIAAAMLLTVLLPQIAMLSSGVRLALWKPLVMFVALVLTLSRSGLLALGVGAVVIVAVRGISKRALRLAGLGVLGLLAFLPQLATFAANYNKLSVSDASAMSRLDAWARALEVFVEHPWFGIGFNTYAFVQEHRGFERSGAASYATEGGLLYIAVMTGIVGLAIFVFMTTLVFRRSRMVWRDTRATSAEKGLAVGAVAVTAAVLVHSVFVNSITVPFVMEPLLVTWGLVYAARARLRAPGVHGG